jgi:uncharacterized membrane protein
MPDAAAFCPGCGRRMIAAPAAAKTEGIANEALLAGLAYITFIPAIFFLLKKPYNENHLVRFHSWQSIFLAIAAVVAGVLLRIVFSLLGFIPWIGHLLAWLAVIVISLGWLILWIVVLIKALQGGLFKLPIVGDFAERV